MKALILTPFHTEYLERLKSKLEVIQESWTDTRKLLAPEEIVERIENQDVQILVIEADFIFDEVFEATDKLRFIGICRGATNHIDINAAAEHGVLVVNTPARNAVSVAEHTIGLILSLARHIPTANTLIKSHEWLDPVEPYIGLRGVELSGKVVGIIGFGAIGYEVAKRLQAFDMKVMVYDPYVNQERLAEIGAKQAELSELVKRSDFITLHCPTLPEIEGMIGKGELALMKPTAYLVNTAGWDLVDEEALLDTLEQRRIAGAAFDIYESHPVPTNSPFLKLDNVVLTPHIGGATDGTIERYSRMMTEEIERFLEGKRPKNLVNPEVWERYDS